MNTLKPMRIVVSILLGALAVPASNALARVFFRGDAGGGSPTTLHEFDESSYIRVIGMLGCNAGDESTHRACELQITESGTGRVYRLIESIETGDETALKLYQSGVRNVAVEGLPAANGVLTVKTTKAI